MQAVLSNPILSRISRIPPAYFVFALLLLVLFITRPQLMNTNVLGIFARQIVPLGILTLGQLLVIRVNSIDLSGAGVLLFVNYFIASSLFADQPIVTYVAISLLTGLVVGLFNGYMVAKRRVSAVIVTLAVNIVIVGVVQFLAGGKPPAAIPKVLNELYNIKFGALPLPVLFWFLLALAMAVFLSRTVFGRNVTSVGDNPTAALFSGVPVERTVVIAHTLAGLMAGLAAFVQTSSIALASSKVGLDLPVLAVAATILGGVVFGKGEGGVWGPFFGVLSFSLLFVVMTTFNIAESGKLIVQGAIILLAAVYYGVRRN